MNKLFAPVAIALIAFMVSGQALACAMCLDIFPETIALSAAASKSVAAQLKLPRSGTSTQPIGEINCSRKYVDWSYYTDKCTFSAGYGGATPIVLTGPAALDLLKKLSMLKAEPNYMSEQDTDESQKPTGKKRLMGERKITSEEYSLYLGVTSGSITCTSQKAKTACAIELTSLNAADQIIELK